jgi:hypothetical protein
LQIEVCERMFYNRENPKWAFTANVWPHPGHISIALARSMGLPRDISPKNIGAQPLLFPVPPMLEEAWLSRESAVCGIWI